MEFVITIRNKIAEYAGDAIYVCGNADCKIVFDFDIAWDGIGVKTARFVKEDGTYQDQVFTGNICPVPVISNTFGIRVGVYAGNLHTTTPAYIPAKKSILCASGLPADPAPDVYAQLMERINEMEKGGVSEEVIKATIEEYLAENPGGGTITDEQLKAAVDVYLTENPIEVPAYELPTASADTLGGVKVGKGLQMDGDVLGVVPEGMYELVKTITLENDVEKITIGELGGDLSECVILIYFPATSITSVVNFFVYDKRGARITATSISGLVSNAAKYAEITLSKKSYGFKAQYRSSTTSAIYGWQDIHSVSNGNVASITLDAIATDAVFPIGTKIDLWGVRADA